MYATNCRTLPPQNHDLNARLIIRNTIFIIFNTKFIVYNTNLAPKRLPSLHCPSYLPRTISFTELISLLYNLFYRILLQNSTRILSGGGTPELPRKVAHVVHRPPCFIKRLSHKRVTQDRRLIDPESSVLMQSSPFFMQYPSFLMQNPPFSKQNSPF